MNRICKPNSVPLKIFHSPPPERTVNTKGATWFSAIQLNQLNSTSSGLDSFSF